MRGTEAPQAISLSAHAAESLRLPDTMKSTCSAWRTHPTGA